MTIPTHKCTICSNKVAKTKANPQGICPAYSCPSNEIFYEQDGDKEAYTKRMALTKKYRTLYFCSPSDYTLHFLYALDKGNLLFIDDVSYTQYVYNEDELEELAKAFPETNYQKLK